MVNFMSTVKLIDFERNELAKLDFNKFDFDYNL